MTRKPARSAAVGAVACLLLAVPAFATPSANLVISQVYGAGGNSGAIYQNDFIEIFNRGASPVSLSGKSLQYASATGTGNFGVTNQITLLPNVSLNPGQYFLVQEAGGSNGIALAPDLVSVPAISMAAGAGKVALVNSTASLGCNGGSNPCSPAARALIIDLVGYGTGSSGANFFEGTGPAPTLRSLTPCSGIRTAPLRPMETIPCVRGAPTPKASGRSSTKLLRN